LGLRHTDGADEGDQGKGLIPIPGTPANDFTSFMSKSLGVYSWTGFSSGDKIALNALWPFKYHISFCGTRPTLGANPNEYYNFEGISPSTTQTGVVFTGWFKDAAHTIPLYPLHGILINSDITLFPSYRSSGASTTIIQHDSYTFASKSFTLTKATGITLTGRIERGLNQWYEISPYSTTAIIGKTTPYRTMYLSQYIWNSNPASSLEYTEGITLPAGTYWIASQFPSALGKQDGASGKHGVVYVIVEYAN